MTKLEQKLLAENEQLHRELDELKQKLEVETSPRVDYVDVYKFYHGLDEIPRNCLIHHDGKDEHSNYDKEKNDIEYLQLMTRAAHTALHNPTLGRFELFTCRICGKIFRARKAGNNCICSRKCRLAAQKQIRDSGKYNETRTCPVCGKNFEVARYKTQKYCSNRCGALAQWQRQKNF